MNPELARRELQNLIDRRELDRVTKIAEMTVKFRLSGRFLRSGMARNVYLYMTLVPNGLLFE